MSLSDYYAHEAKFPKTGRKPDAEPAPKLKGPIATARHKKQLAQARTKAAIREQVRELDGYRCRWPECDTDPETTAGALEVAHQKAAGSGGDPLLDRYVPENLLCCCHFHHQSGPRSLHSGLAKLQTLNPSLGMRGLVQFFERERTEVGRWYLVGVSEPPKVQEG